MRLAYSAILLFAASAGVQAGHLYKTAVKGLPPAAAPAVPPPVFSSCLAIKQANPTAASGVHTIRTGGAASPEVSVYCEMDTDGGGWSLVFSGTGNSAGAPAVSLASLVRGNPVTTYTTDPARYPVLPNGTINTFTQALHVGTNPAWISLTGAWNRFDTLPAGTTSFNCAYTGVLNANGSTALYHHAPAWGVAVTDLSSSLSLWHVRGANPQCGGHGVYAPADCPAFWSSTYPHHFDVFSHRQLFMR